MKDRQSGTGGAGARIASLDGVRGLAILGVIVFHTMKIGGAALGASLILRPLTDSSWAGVELFFVLSGFLITGILLDTREDERYFRKFYARRALRILPLYYTVLTVTLVLLPLTIGAARLPGLYARLTDNQVWLWVFLQNYVLSKGAHQLPGFGHFWTLAIEEQFYWLWPIAVYCMSRRRLLGLCLAICVTEPVLRLALLHNGFSLWAIRELTFTRVDTLLYGAIAALLIREPDLLPWRRGWVPVAALGALGFLGFVVFGNGGFSGFLPYESSQTALGGYSALGIICALFVYASASRTRVAHGMRSPFLCWFGRYSYAIYIVHPPLVYLYQTAVDPRIHSNSLWAALLRFASVTLIAVALAWLSWILLENRCLKLKRYFEYGATPARPMATITMAEANAAPGMARSRT